MNSIAELSLLVFVSGIISFNILFLTMPSYCYYAEWVVWQLFFQAQILEAVNFKRINFFIANIFKSGRHFEAAAMAIL